MKKYDGCPEGYEILEEHPLYVVIIEVVTKGIGGVYSLKLPAQFWPRFIYDEEWRRSLFSVYARLVYTEDHPRKDYVFNGRVLNIDRSAENKSGIVPEDLRFAHTKYPHCPLGFGKISEDDLGVKLDYGYIDGSEGGTIEVPAKHWDKFITDKKWRNRVLIKYTRLKEIDWKTKDEIISKYSEQEFNQTGIIPIDEP